LTFKKCRRIFKLLKDLSPQKVAMVSQGLLGLYFWVINSLKLRIINAITNKEVIPQRLNSPKKRTMTAGRDKDNSDIKKEMKESVYSSNVHNADVHNTFAQTASQANKGSKNYDSLDYDWRLFRKDSPVRRRILKNQISGSRKSGVDADRRTDANLPVKLENVGNPLYNSFSYENYDYPDLDYARHRQDIEIDKAIQKERMKEKNIKNTKSRVSYHWSPKRRKEMREESDTMTHYYTERFIKDVLKDIDERNLTRTQGTEYLKEFGYDLKVQTDPDSGIEEFTAVKTVEEVVKAESPQKVIEEEQFPKEKESDERVLLKELALGKDLLRRAGCNISEESLLELTSDYYLNSDDQQLVRVFMGLLELANHGEQIYYPTWTKVQSELGYTNDWIKRIDNFENMVEHYTIPKYKIEDMRKSFQRYAQYTSDKPYIKNIQEYL
jgi:hypothetical protein